MLEDLYQRQILITDGSAKYLFKNTVQITFSARLSIWIKHYLAIKSSQDNEYQTELHVQLFQYICEKVKRRWTDKITITDLWNIVMRGFIDAAWNANGKKFINHTFLQIRLAINVFVVQTYSQLSKHRFEFRTNCWRGQYYHVLMPKKQTRSTIKSSGESR